MLRGLPDGENSLVFTSPMESKEGSEHRSLQLETIDLRNGTHSIVPSSQGMGDALWMTPDMLVAWKDDTTKLVALNVKNGKDDRLGFRSDCGHGCLTGSKYVYYEAGGPEPKAMRIRVADNKLEEITSLENLRIPTYIGGAIAVAPDGFTVFPLTSGRRKSMRHNPSGLERLPSSENESAARCLAEVHKESGFGCTIKIRQNRFRHRGARLHISFGNDQHQFSDRWPTRSWPENRHVEIIPDQLPVFTNAFLSSCRITPITCS